MIGSTRRYDAEQLRRISEVTIAHYDRLAEAYWDGTRDHDVTQNYAAFLDAIEGDPPYSILDLGCGPGCQRRREIASAGGVRIHHRLRWRGGPVQLVTFQTQLSSSINEPAFPSRPASPEPRRAA